MIQCQTFAATCPSRWSRPYASTRSRSPDVRRTSITAARATCSSACVTSATSNPSATSPSRTSSSVGRPPGAPNTASTRPAAANPRKMPPRTSDGNAVPRYIADERDQDHEEQEHPAERPHDVRREHEGQRGDDRDVGGGEDRAVTGADVDAEPVDALRIEDLVEQLAHSPRQHAGDRDVQRDGDLLQEQEHERHADDRPDRSERVEGVRDVLEAVREVVDGLEEVRVEARLGLRPQAGEPDADDTDGGAHDVGRPPLGWFLGALDPGHSAGGDGIREWPGRASRHRGGPRTE